MVMEVKSMQLKALEASGEGAALFSVWGVPDADLDITERGFFGNDQEVFLLPHHLWQSGLPPLGKGVIREEREGAVYRFKMNMALDTAKSWHQHFLFDLREGREARQQWSYGYRVRPGGSTPLPNGGRRLHATPEGLPGAMVIEVSPVTAAAQPLGRTLGAKVGADVIRQGTPVYRQVLQIRQAMLQRELAFLKARQAENTWFAAEHQRLRRLMRERRYAHL